MSKKTSGRLVLLAAATALGALPLVGRAQTVEGDLFYSTFRAPNPLFPIGPEFISDGTVNKVHFTYDGTSFSLGSPSQIHSYGTASSADGLVFAPDGDLLVGGTDGTVHKLKTNGTVVGDSQLGVAQGFHLAISPDNKTAFTAGLPGALATVPLDPFGNGTTHVLNGDDVNITQIAFDGSGNAYYTSSTEQGNGEFGKIDLTTFTTTRLIAALPAAHGIVFDSFTNNLILSGDGHISQIDPANPSALASDFTTDLGSTVELDHFDQLSTDGKGHLFVAVNDGTLLFMDYSASSKVGDAGNVVSSKFLQNFLDDVAPLSGPGAPPEGGGGGGGGGGAVPLPAAIWPGLSMLAGMGMFKGLKRRSAR
jgi:hypothetical protein